MSVPHLSVVRPEDNPDSPAARANRLYAEAREAAKEQVRQLESSLEAAISLAADIAEGGELYPPGVRDLCRRLAEDMSQRCQTLEAIVQRSPS